MLFLFPSSFIFSSFGQSAVFLVGGQTREQKPTPMFLQSGDIIVMGGPARRAYHAIPRILPSTVGNIPQCLQSIPELTSHGGASSEKSSTGNKPSSAIDLECTLTGKRTDSSEGCGKLQEDAEVGTGSQSPKADLSSGKKRGSESETDNLESESASSSAKVLCTEQSNIATRTMKDSQSAKGADEIRDIFDINLDLRDLCCRENWDPFAAYLECSRINVSVRQVMKPGQGFPQS